MTAGGKLPRMPRLHNLAVCNLLATRKLRLSTTTTIMNGNKFNSRFTYGQQHDVYYDDGRELELLKKIFAQPTDKLEQLRNNPTAVLEAIDSFATEKYLMNIGEMKGKLVCDLIRERRPKTVVELGGYVGYSTILFGSAVRVNADGPAKYYCVEHNPVFAAVIMALVELAGLSDTVKVVIGGSTECIKRMHANGALKNIDMLFLDHLKHLYTPDLKLCESLNLIKVGTVLAADNMIKPGNPQYHRYVNLSVSDKKAALKKQDEFPGNPNLVYDSKFMESWEPQGVPDALEITRCTAVVE